MQPYDVSTIVPSLWKFIIGVISNCCSTMPCWSIQNVNRKTYTSVRIIRHIMPIRHLWACCCHLLETVDFEITVLTLEITIVIYWSQNRFLLRNEYSIRRPLADESTGSTEPNMQTGCTHWFDRILKWYDSGEAASYNACSSKWRRGKLGCVQVVNG